MFPTSVNHNPARLRVHRLPPVAFCLLALFAVPGCAILGVAANAIPKYTSPEYKGFVGQSVGVMVWIDRPTMIEWPAMRLDLGSAVLGILQRNAGAKELKGVTYPWPAASYVKYQVDHPETQFASILDVAPKLYVTRLIYIEVERFHTRAEASLELYRGVMSATVKVIEISNGTAKVAYEKNGISVAFPRKAPNDGVANVTDYDMYRGAIVEMTKNILGKFTTQEVED